MKDTELEDRFYESKLFWDLWLLLATNGGWLEAGLLHPKWDFVDDAKSVTVKELPLYIWMPLKAVEFDELLKGAV